MSFCQLLMLILSLSTILPCYFVILTMYLNTEVSKTSQDKEKARRQQLRRLKMKFGLAVNRLVFAAVHRHTFTDIQCRTLDFGFFIKSTLCPGLLQVSPMAQR